MMQNTHAAIRRPRFMEDEDPLQNPEQQALQRVFGAVGARPGLPTTNTGVAGGIDRGAPMAMGQVGAGPISTSPYDTSEGPGGLSGTLERPNFQQTPLPGAPPGSRACH